MKKYVFGLLFCCLLSFPAFSEETEDADNAEVEQTVQPEENADSLVRYTHYGEMPEIKELDESEDDLYSDADVKPMEIRISEDEKQQDLNTDLDYVDKEFVLSELSCDNENLTRQVARFIQEHSNVDGTSVKSQRNRILMIKNLRNFAEVKEDDLSKGNFNTRAALMHLRINENREIYKICESKDNRFGKFSNVYLILYPYFKYYKVVVTNLISIPEKVDDATFIYNW